MYKTMSLVEWLTQTKVRCKTLFYTYDIDNLQVYLNDTFVEFTSISNYLILYRLTSDILQGINTEVINSIQEVIDYITKQFASVSYELDIKEYTVRQQQSMQMYLTQLGKLLYVIKYSGTIVSFT